MLDHTGQNSRYDLDRMVMLRSGCGHRGTTIKKFVEVVTDKTCVNVVVRKMWGASKKRKSAEHSSESSGCLWKQVNNAARIFITGSIFLALKLSDSTPTLLRCQTGAQISRFIEPASIKSSADVERSFQEIWNRMISLRSLLLVHSSASKNLETICHDLLPLWANLILSLSLSLVPCTKAFMLNLIVELSCNLLWTASSITKTLSSHWASLPQAAQCNSDCTEWLLKNIQFLSTNFVTKNEFQNLWWFFQNLLAAVSLATLNFNRHKAQKQNKKKHHYWTFSWFFVRDNFKNIINQKLTNCHSQKPFKTDCHSSDIRLAVSWI